MFLAQAHARLADALDGPGEQRLGVVHEVLVQRVVAGHEHGQRGLPRTPRAPGLLPEARPPPGPPGHHHRIEPGDVDAQLQGRRRGHPPERAVAQPPLDGVTLLRQVAAPVGGHGVDEGGQAELQSAAGAFGAFLLGGLWGVVLMLRGRGRSARMPFGPFMIGGALAETARTVAAGIVNRLEIKRLRPAQFFAAQARAARAAEEINVPAVLPPVVPTASAR